MNFCMACGAPVELSGEKFCNKCRFANDKQYQSDVRRRFGERLRQARLAAGLTQAQLGESLRLSQKAISSYEVGAREPKLAQMVRFAYKLNRSVGWFLDANTLVLDD